MKRRVVYRFEGRGIWVDLSSERLGWCWFHGKRIRNASTGKGLNDHQAEQQFAQTGTHPDEDKSWSLQAYGVIGEWAARYALGINDDEWMPGEGVFKSEADIGFGVDARSAHVANYGLRIWDNELGLLRRVMVLVLLHEIPDLRPTKTGLYMPGRALVAGYYPIKEVTKYPDWRTNFNLPNTEPQFTVPQANLRPIEHLKEIVAARLAGLPDPPKYQEPEDLYTGPRTASQSRAVSNLWKPDRSRKDAEQQALFTAEQRARKAAIERGEYDQPEKYRGQVFDRATNQGMAYDATPPYRDDPFSGLTEAFVEFQEYRHLTKVRPNKSYYCVECVARFANVVCPHAGCHSARVELTTEDGPGLKDYRCLTCSRSFQAERVCGPCLSERPEVQERLREEREKKATRKATTRTLKSGTRSRKGSVPRNDDMGGYPD